MPLATINPKRENDAEDNNPNKRPRHLMERGVDPSHLAKCLASVLHDLVTTDVDMVAIQAQLDKFLEGVTNRVDNMTMTINYLRQNNEDTVEQLYTMAGEILTCDNLEPTARSTILRAMKRRDERARQNEIEAEDDGKSVKSDNDDKKINADNDDNANNNNNDTYNPYADHNDQA
ncbi:hypothetical protein EMCG_04690 [[Emmonsia] crescens]|uniref:Uncharacterized protein n=1 Tax=[Emmonsia] crescens TaxID=73230 RepID=A0A0G2IYJ8_9EURO|nr:hypothetical protein EMCG_04690 [Emmonsia crescens UAMH 3008]